MADRWTITTEGRRDGPAAAGARLLVVGLLVVLQYWLLVVTVEAVLAGDTWLALPAFMAQLGLLALSAGLLWVGERDYGSSG